MPKFTMIVLSRPVEGREAEFNDWYSNRHLDDVLKIDGITSAMRLKLVKPVSGSLAPYCALYEIEADDPKSVCADLLAQTGTDEMPVSDSMAVADVGIFEFLVGR